MSHPEAEYLENPYDDETEYETPLPIGNAVASLVFGILAMLAAPAGAGVVGVIAVILGHITRRDVRRGTARGDGLAIAGLIMGYIGVIMTATVVLNALAR